MQDRISISSRNIKLTPANKKYILKKLKFLDRFKKYIKKIKVEINDKKGEDKKIKYDVTISLKRGNLRVEEEGTDLYSIIDKAHDTIKMKIEKEKDKFTDYKDKEKDSLKERLLKPLRNFIPKKDLAAIEKLNETIASYEPKIVKRKKYSDNRPLHPAEAIDQMEILGHICFLFKNIETKKYAMIYKREDGNYALVEPENS